MTIGICSLMYFNDLERKFTKIGLIFSDSKRDKQQALAFSFLDLKRAPPDQKSVLS